MEFKQNILPNGLTLIGEINKSAKSAAIGFFVKTGSRDETPEINGVSHFLEHMVFKGTDKLDALEVNHAFDNTGAQFNAFTSEESTVFHAAVLPEYLDKVTQLWTELMRPALRDDDFNIEKNVIKQEIAMYKDLPGFDVLEKCRKLYFGDNPCGNSVLGSEQSIDAMAAQQMRDYFANRYAPNNIVVAVSGNLDWQQTCDLIEARCGSWQNMPTQRKTEHYKAQSKNKRIEKDNTVCEHICLIGEGVPAQDKARFAASLFATITGDSLGSRFYWELVDNALAEEASMSFGPMDGTGVFYSYICCQPANTDKVLSIIRKIFAELLETGITDDELQKAKNKTLSALVIKNEVPMGRLLDLGFGWMYLQQYRTLAEDIADIKAVTVNDVNELIRRIQPGIFTQFSISPAAGAC